MGRKVFDVIHQCLRTRHAQKSTKRAYMGYGAFLGASSAQTLVDDIQILLARCLLNKKVTRWTLLPRFPDTLCSVKENDKKVQPWQGPRADWRPCQGCTFLLISFTEHSVWRKVGSNAHLLSIPLSRERAKKYSMSSTRSAHETSPKEPQT